MKEFEKCLSFLKKNGWVPMSRNLNDPKEEYISFNKNKCIGIDINSKEIVLVDNHGDRKHIPTIYFALIGVLIEYRQISCGYISIK